MWELCGAKTKVKTTMTNPLKKSTFVYFMHKWGWGWGGGDGGIL